MERALDELGRLGIRGLVLDLRQNKGGLARELDRIASLLLPAGLTTYTHQASQGPHVAATAGGPRLPPTVPLVVLVDAETASNAEVLAAALRDHGRGVLLGTRTKGAAQLAELFRLPGGTGILVPTARMTTSLGVDLEGRGLTPVLRERGMSRVPLPVSSGFARDCLAAGSC
jgi:carboxyl-terminal processing protease